MSIRYSQALILSPNREDLASWSTIFRNGYNNKKERKNTL